MSPLLGSHGDDRVTLANLSVRGGEGGGGGSQCYTCMTFGIAYISRIVHCWWPLGNANIVVSDRPYRYLMETF